MVWRKISYLGGQTIVNYINNRKTEINNITGSIKRTMTEDERNLMDNPPDDNLKEINIDDKILKESISVKSIEIGLNRENIPNKFTKRNSIFKQLTKTIAHELIGHAYFDALENPVSCFLWQRMQNVKTVPGHEPNNPSGTKANEVSENVENNFQIYVE